MDLEEFLTENGIPVEQQLQHQQQHNGHPPSNNNNGSVNSGSGGSSSNNSSSNGMTSGDQVSGEECSPSPRANGGHLAQQLPQQQQPHHVGQYGPGPSARNNQGHNNHNDHIIHHNNLSNPQNLLRGPPSIHTQSESVSRSPSPCGSSISRSSDDSTSTLPPGHHHEGKYPFKYFYSTFIEIRGELLEHISVQNTFFPSVKFIFETFSVFLIYSENPHTIYLINIPTWLVLFYQVY